MFIEESDEKISYNKKTGELKIQDLTYEDGGTYKCLASNQFRIDSTENNLNVLSMSISFISFQ